MQQAGQLSSNINLIDHNPHVTGDERTRKMTKPTPEDPDDDEDASLAAFKAQVDQHEAARKQLAERFPDEATTSDQMLKGLANDVAAIAGSLPVPEIDAGDIETEEDAEDAAIQLEEDAEAYRDAATELDAIADLIRAVSLPSVDDEDLEEDSNEPDASSGQGG
jgi:hypothetical protein